MKVSVDDANTQLSKLFWSGASRGPLARVTLVWAPGSPERLAICWLSRQRRRMVSVGSS
jgi:hypothetical protein